MDNFAFIDLISVEPGKAVVELQANQVHANARGTLHGGILCDIADAAIGIAYASNLDEGDPSPRPLSNKPNKNPV